MNPIHKVEFKTEGLPHYRLRLLMYVDGKACANLVLSLNDAEALSKLVLGGSEPVELSKDSHLCYLQMPDDPTKAMSLDDPRDPSETAEMLMNVKVVPCEDQYEAHKTPNAFVCRDVHDRVCIFPSEGGFLAAHMLAFEGDIAPFAG
jgi:hypothetical protein